MKSMHIAASCELVTRLSTHRRVVALDSTDFTDVAAVVISVADSRSGILTLLRRSGFNLPVYLLSETAVDKPEGVQAVIAGKDQEWLELEAAACDYEARLLPPFFNTLTQYVEMDNSTFPFGFIGGIDERCFDEHYLRDLIREAAPEKANASRPFRLAVIQLGTYDGTVYNARQVVDKIGHLCDYILFDSAWVGYEQFIPMMADCSPLLLELTPDDPGIFVTQSVHKQQAGFSQTSQIHKKDNHLRGQARFCPHKRLNNAFMLHASTSPFYPLFAALDVNAKIHEGESGRRLWAECVALGIEARKAIIANCKMIQPFIPPVVAGRPWQDHPTEAIARERRFFSFEPDARWGQFEQHIEADTPLADVLPTIYNKYPVRYRDYTLRELCQEMHDLYVSFDVKSLQKEMFRKRSFPRVVMNPQDANHEFIRGNVELVRLSEAEGRVAAEGALPYPPGVLCVVPGEVWGGAVLRYFLALEEGVNMLPGFSPELQGVYSETDPDGIKRLYGYVLKG